MHVVSTLRTALVGLASVAALALGTAVPAHADEPPDADVTVDCEQEPDRCGLGVEVPRPTRTVPSLPPPYRREAPVERARPPAPDGAPAAEPEEPAPVRIYRPLGLDGRGPVGGYVDMLDPALLALLEELANEPPPAAAAPAVAPEVLAQRAYSELALDAPPIRTSRPPGSEGATVGFPLWMWIDPGPASSGPTSATASAGGVTVTATAVLQRVVWDMGDGTTVTCNGPGTPFDLSRAGAASPDCGHVCTAVASGVTITATSVWQVIWEGGGASGEDALQPTAQVLAALSVTTGGPSYAPGNRTKGSDAQPAGFPGGTAWGGRQAARGPARDRPRRRRLRGGAAARQRPSGYPGHESRTGRRTRPRGGRERPALRRRGRQSLLLARRHRVEHRQHPRPRRGGALPRHPRGAGLQRDPDRGAVPACRRRRPEPLRRPPVLRRPRRPRRHRRRRSR